jgi:palmitoyltransferase ZDHHC2/15/20
LVQGFRTYPSFLHFLASVTLLSAYIAAICIRGLVFAFSHPLAIVRSSPLPLPANKPLAETNLDVQNEITPVHMLLLSFAGCAFALVIGSFLIYHIYLVLCVVFLFPPFFFFNNKQITAANSTNQTTLEHISPFYLLRHLPPFPPRGGLSSPPREQELDPAQRRAVRATHAQMRLYDVGWRRNVAQVFGVGGGGDLGASANSCTTKRYHYHLHHHYRWRRWAARLLWGGSWYVQSPPFFLVLFVRAVVLVR